MKKQFYRNVTLLTRSTETDQTAMPHEEPVGGQGVTHPRSQPHTSRKPFFFTECSHPVHSVFGDNSDGLTWIPTRQSCLMGNLLGSGWYPPTLTTTHTKETFSQMYLTRLTQYLETAVMGMVRILTSHASWGIGCDLRAFLLRAYTHLHSYPLLRRNNFTEI